MNTRHCECPGINGGGRTKSDETGRSFGKDAECTQRGPEAAVRGLITVCFLLTCSRAADYHSMILILKLYLYRIIIFHDDGR